MKDVDDFLNVIDLQIDKNKSEIKKTKTNRKVDMKNEQEVQKFLDEKFYPEYTTEFKRFLDYSTQMLGVDVSFSIFNLKNILVDEKAMTQYINQDIPTFAFELSFRLKDGNRVVGWLLDDNKKTQYYLLVWVFADNESNGTFSKDDITYLECILIERKTILDFLASEGLDKQALLKKNQEILGSSINGAIDRDVNDSFYFYLSGRLREKPINIIFKKSKLIELGILHKKIYREDKTNLS